MKHKVINILILYTIFIGCAMTLALVRFESKPMPILLIVVGGLSLSGLKYWHNRN